MKRWCNVVLLLCLCVASCFKRHPLNENALLQQRLCIESLDIKDFERARRHCELCIEFDKAMPECLNGLGLVALANNDEEKAKTFFTNAVRQDNDFSQALNNLGVIYFTNADYEMALRYFDRALGIDPANTDARYNAALSHFRLGERAYASGKKSAQRSHLETAKDQMSKLVALEPTYTSAFRDLGLIELSFYEVSEFEQERRGHLMAAKAAFTTCIDSNNADNGCYEGLGRVYYEEGRFEQSFANFFTCLNYEPNNSACRRGIVSAYEKNVKSLGGYQQLAKNTHADNKNAHAHEAFCHELFERGFYDEAVRECEVALRIDPSLCTVQFRLADHFATILNPERAVHHCQAFFTCNTQGISPEMKKCQEIVAAVKN